MNDAATAVDMFIVLLKAGLLLGISEIIWSNSVILHMSVHAACRCLNGDGSKSSRYQFNLLSTASLS